MVLRVGNNRKTRHTSFNLYLKQNQCNHSTGEITGMMTTVRHTKRARNI